VLADVSLDDTFTYDGDMAYQLYLGWIEGWASMEDLICYLKRLIIKCVWAWYILPADANPAWSMLNQDDWEDVIQTFLLDVWKLAREKRVPTENPALFHEYLHKVIRRRVVDVVRRRGRRKPKRIPAGGYSSLSTVSTARDVETALFLEDLPARLRRQILEGFRFEDSQELEAVAYIVDRLTAGKDVVDHWLRVRYGLLDPQWLVEHVQVRLRMLLNRTRKQLSGMGPTAQQKKWGWIDAVFGETR
jgi:hypothetical protein